MGRLAVTYPDAEKETRALLAALLEEQDIDATVAIGIPHDWTPDTGDHLQVSSDGTPSIAHPVVSHSTIRITAWSASTSRAKELANLAFGLLCAHDGTPPIAAILPLTGVLPARDPESRAELAYVTVRVSVRSVPI